MCNARNHSSSCDCGFGPPYDRDVQEFFDRQVGSWSGRDLSSAGPRCNALNHVLRDTSLTTRLVSTFVWQSYLGVDSKLVEKTSSQTTVAEAQITAYIVQHALGVPRHDLLLLDPSIPKDQVRQGFVDLKADQLRSGWRNFRAAYDIGRKSAPAWLSGLNLDDVPGIAEEALSVQRHFYIAIHPPRMVLTSGPNVGFPAIPPGAIAVGTKRKNLATAGIISQDKQGRTGVTTALHAVQNRRSPFFVQGFPGSITARDSLTDSCFIHLDDLQIPSGTLCSGPLRGVTPRGEEPVWFEGISSGRKETRVTGWTFELPWVGEGVQARVLTPLVTQLGDSGAALVNGDGKVIGFSHSRTEVNTRSPLSIWIWAESVFSALGLQ